MSEYDVIVVGSGLAGLTAGLFSARHGLSTLILESNIPGGHLISIEKIEDFPGFPDGIAGYDFCPTVQGQRPTRERSLNAPRSSSSKRKTASGRSSPTKNPMLPKRSLSPRVRR